MHAFGVKVPVEFNWYVQVMLLVRVYCVGKVIVMVELTLRGVVRKAVEVKEFVMVRSKKMV